MATANGETARRKRLEISELIGNAMMSRSELLRSLMDPRRDIDDECGYPKTQYLTPQMYRDLYDREPVAARVVEVLPKESWSTSPSVYEQEDSESLTAFEQAWQDVARSLRGTSWYGSEEGNPIWEHLRRADILSGIGGYGVLLLGLDDGKTFEEPVDGVNEDGTARGKPQNRKLLYMRAFDESLAPVAVYESNESNPRYGQPVFYNITFADPNEQSRGGMGLPNATRKVHWSRIIHLADNLGSSEVFGIPRMRHVFNRLYDLRKLYSGSAEMYWRGAFPGLALETNPQLGGDVTIDYEAIRTDMENYFNGLQRYLALMGITAKTLAPTVVDPTPQINTQVQAICIKLGIPQRIFMGSERGELASSQDEGSWNDVLRDRQNGYITPRIIVPFIDRLILVGVLPQPKEYTVEWPDLESLSDQEQAQVAVTRTDALTRYVQGGAEALVAPMDWLTRWLGMDQDEAAAILQTTQDRIKEEDTGGSPLLSMVGGITGMIQLFQQFKDGVIGEETLKQQIMLFFRVDEQKASDIIADGLPEQPEPQKSPIKLKDGETLVHPDTVPPPAKKPNPFAAATQE